MLKLKTPIFQTRRHRGAYRGRAPPTGCLWPPNENCSPPKRGLCPEKINRLGASGAQIEAQINVFCGLTPDFVTFLGWRPFFFFEICFRLENSSEDLFFFEITFFRPEKPLEILISAGKSLEISVKTFFIYLFFWRSPAFGRKNRLEFRFRPENHEENSLKFFLLTFFICSRVG